MKFTYLFWVVVLCSILGCKNREYSKNIHIYCDDVQRPWEIYTYYVNERGREVKHGDYFKIRHHKNGYISVFSWRFEHGMPSTNASFDFPLTHAWIAINEDRTTNTTVTVVEKPQ